MGLLVLPLLAAAPSALDTSPAAEGNPPIATLPPGSRQPPSRKNPLAGPAYALVAP